jgi:hypothetical protein
MGLKVAKDVLAVHQVLGTTQADEKNLLL